VALSASVDGGTLAIDIDDSGPGMPAHVAAFLADTAAPAPIVDGSGLGLWVARRMAAEIGGTLTAETSALGGARVRLTVPVVAEEKELSRVA
jgi:signal transduction histidine kinase